MNWVTWIYAISALASALAAILAWAAKLWWAKEYSSAKDETIKSKDAQIERMKSELQSIREATNDIVKAKDTQIGSLKNEVQNLKDLTPMKIQEYFRSVKSQLEEYNDMLQKQLDKALAEIKEKDTAIITYSQNTDAAINQISELKEEKARLEEKAKVLERQLKIVREEESEAEYITKIYIPGSALKGTIRQAMGRLNRKKEDGDDENANERDLVDALFGSENDIPRT